MRTDLSPVGNEAGKSRYVRGGFLPRIIGTAAVILIAGGSAFGEFGVQPMKIQTPVQPGKRFSVELKLENLDRTVTETIGLRVVELTQRLDGAWLDFNSNDPNVDQTSLKSCSSWLSFEKDTVEVRPGTIEPVRLIVEVPPGTRGYYFAAVRAQSSPRPGLLEGVTTMMALQYVIPVALEVTGRPMRHQVELRDVGLEFQEQTDNSPAVCLVAMDIQNEGGTYSRLTGMWRIWNQQKGHWRKVTETKFVDMGIIPGVKLHITQDVKKPLSSGMYKVEGFLLVDGDRSGQVEKDLEFKGDPQWDPTKTDAALEIIGTREVLLETLPGGAQARTVAVVNASDEAVVVSADLVLPEHMSNRVSANGIPGEQFGCSDWVTVEPQQFTLQGHARQNVRVTARMPASATILPNYYGVIQLRSTYPDGQAGGLSQIPVCVHNKRAQNSVQISKLVFSISLSSPSRYFVTARFMNAGDSHVVPTCKAVVTSATTGAVTGGMEYTRFTLRSERYDRAAMLLPLDTRDFIGVLDVSNMPVGTYRLTAVLEYGKAPGDNFQDQIAIDVVEQGGNKEVVVGDMSRIGGKTVITL